MRILNLLQFEELSVAEMQEILEMGQSRISSHLALLRGADLVTDRREGKRSYYARNQMLPNSEQVILSSALKATQDDPEFARDRLELERILEERRKVAERYFDAIAGRLGKAYCPGRSWEAIGHLLLELTPHIDIADLGAGEGMISHLLARRARMVTCIDNAPRMIEVGTRLAHEHDLQNIQYLLGDIESVPLETGCVDLALLSQALHHARRPAVALAEAFRILRPGGRVLVLDLKEHMFEKARELYADTWLGFREGAMRQMLHEAGFQLIEVRIVAREQVEPFFETILATGMKPN